MYPDPVSCLMCSVADLTYMQYGIEATGNGDRKFAVDMQAGRIYVVGELLYDEQDVSLI